MPDPLRSRLSLTPASALLRDLVHDLRQPLANIDTCACLLEILVPDEEQRIRRHLALIQQEVENAERLLAQAAATLGGGAFQRESDTAVPVSLDLTNSVSAALT